MSKRSEGKWHSGGREFDPHRLHQIHETHRDGGRKAAVFRWRATRTAMKRVLFVIAILLLAGVALTAVGRWSSIASRRARRRPPTAKGFASSSSVMRSETPSRRCPSCAERRAITRRRLRQDCARHGWADRPFTWRSTARKCFTGLSATWARGRPAGEPSSFPLPRRSRQGEQTEEPLRHRLVPLDFHLPFPHGLGEFLAAVRDRDQRFG